MKFARANLVLFHEELFMYYQFLYRWIARKL